MDSHTTRRGFLCAGAAVVAGLSSEGARAGPPTTGPAGVLWPGFPRQDAARVAEVVGAAHANGQRVRELVEGYPELVNAWWDWGFGDWESPLGAAAHTGRREIAEFLLSRGARIDIFAAAMLGYTDVVKAFVAAQPGVQRTLGPHGIPLLAHARAGGPSAADTLAYLESLGDAGTGLTATPLPASDRQIYLGEFASAQPELAATCRLNNAGLLVLDVRAGEARSNNRIIHYAGDDEFFPSGVASVRIRFALQGNQATSLTFRGSVPEVMLLRLDR